MGFEGSVEQTREPMDKNRIRGVLRRTSGQMIAKSTSIKGAGRKFGGCARKAVELTSGDLPFVCVSGLGKARAILTGTAEVSKGRSIFRKEEKARTVLRKGVQKEW